MLGGSTGRGVSFTRGQASALPTTSRDHTSSSSRKWILRFVLICGGIAFASMTLLHIFLWHVAVTGPTDERPAVALTSSHKAQECPACPSDSGTQQPVHHVQCSRSDQKRRPASGQPLVSLPRYVSATRALFRQYVETHNRQMQGLTASNWKDRKFVVLETRDQMGWGNKLEGVIGAFVFALLTDRALLIEEPFLHQTMHTSDSRHNTGLDSFLLQPDFDWRYESFEAATKGGYNKPRRNSGSVRGVSHKFELIHGGPGTPIAMRSFLRDDLRQIKEAVVRIDTNQYFVPLFVMNPHFKDMIASTFGVDLFGPCARFLLRPLPHIQQKIDAFRAAYFSYEDASVSHSFSLQIRAKDQWPMTKAQQHTFFKCAEGIRANLLPGVTNVTLFLATDTMQLRKEARDSMLHWFGGDIQVNLAYYDAPISRDETEGNINGMIDMWLIGEADTVIISGSSTYGYVGHARTSRVPYHVGFRENCYREISSQPCFHWFNDVWAHDKEWEFERVRDLMPDLVNLHTCWPGEYPDVFLKKFHPDKLLKKLI